MFVQDTMANNQDYLELGQACADVCEALYQRLKGRQPDGLSRPLLDAIGNLNRLAKTPVHTPSGPLTDVSIAVP